MNQNIIKIVHHHLNAKHCSTKMSLKRVTYRPPRHSPGATRVEAYPAAGHHLPPLIPFLPPEGAVGKSPCIVGIDEVLLRRASSRSDGMGAPPRPLYVASFVPVSLVSSTTRDYRWSLLLLHLPLSCFHSRACSSFSRVDPPSTSPDLHLVAPLDVVACRPAPVQPVCFFSEDMALAGSHLL